MYLLPYFDIAFLSESVFRIYQKSMSIFISSDCRCSSDTVEN